MPIRLGRFEQPKHLRKEVEEKNYGKFVAEPFETGYGHTIGNAMRRVLLSSLEGAAVTSLKVEGASHEFATIEGVAADGKLHPMQAAFREEHGLQCGFCTPGMVMMGLDIASRHKNPSDAVIRHELEGNLCRCTGYHNIVKAIAAGAKAMAG